jgi:membrane protease YdiL (CAAX protease family)
MVSEQPPSDLPPATPPVTARPVAYAALQPLNPLDLASVSRRDAALDLGLLVLVALLLPIGFELTAVLTAPQVPELLSGGLIIVEKWFDAVLVVVLAAYFICRQHVPPAAFGLRGRGAAQQALWALPALLAVYAVFMLFVMVVGAFVLHYPELKEDLLRRTQFVSLLPVNNMLATVLLLIPAAIHEELLFRGLLIPYLHRIGCNWPVAVLISTAVFASLHFNQGWLAIIQIFGVGVVLGTCFVLTRSLLAVVLTHFVFDFVQLQLVRLVEPWLEQFTKAAA